MYISLMKNVKRTKLFTKTLYVVVCIYLATMKLSLQWHFDYDNYFQNIWQRIMSSQVYIFKLVTQGAISPVTSTKTVRIL